MKIDKKLIKELVDNLKEFELTELEYQDGQTKIKVSNASKGIEQIKTSAIVSPNKAVLKSADDSDGIRVKSPIIGTAYHAPEPGDKKFIEIGKDLLSLNRNSKHYIVPESNHNIHMENNNEFIKILIKNYHE